MASENQERLERLILEIARSLVETPDNVSVTSNHGPDGVRMNLRVANDDLLRVVGKDGRTARSLQTILSATGAKHSERYTLGIDVSEVGAL
jgi:predicted RNA-binding protein YlqC (UPF0109 family)